MAEAPPPTRHVGGGIALREAFHERLRRERDAVLAEPGGGALPAERLVVPLYYAGLAPGATVTVAAVDLGNGRGLGVPAAPQQHVLGADKGAGPTDIVLEVSLPPRSYAAYLVSVAAGVEL